MGNNENIKNGEILFIYEAKVTNPNGDINDENRPRMDYKTETNLVSDVRLKRYIRDYFSDKNEMIFVNRGRVSTADERLLEASGNDKEIRKDMEKAKDFVKKFLDIRLFGSMIPIQKPKSGDNQESNENGNSIKIVGPVQFTWGYSLNKVELLNSYSINGAFLSSSGKKNSTIGKDYRLYYSLIAFYGLINSKRAEKSGLTNDDLIKFDDAMINSIPEQASRSKIGQKPLFYLRTSSDSKYIGDLRDYIKVITKKEPIRNESDYSIDTNDLKRVLTEQNIAKEKVWADKMLDLENFDL